MELKVEIDLQDLWSDEATVSEQIQYEITSRLKDAFWKELKNEVKEELTEQVQKEIAENVHDKIIEAIELVAKKDSFKIDRYDKEEVSLSDWVKKKFNDSSAWDAPAKKVEELAKKYSVEMRNRYDMLFASQLVSKMNDQGLLKEGVFKAIMDTNKG